MLIWIKDHADRQMLRALDFQDTLLGLAVFVHRELLEPADTSVALRKRFHGVLPNCICMRCVTAKNSLRWMKRSNTARANA